MADEQPLLFRKSAIGGKLEPVNAAAADAVRAIQGTCRVRITRVTANQRRRALYWVILQVAAEALSDRTDAHLDAELLHDLLKRKLMLGEEIRLPSGDVIFKPRSTSDKSMSEPDRARWLERCSGVLANWLGVPMATLLDEARAKHEQTFN